jgi:hypothetical protein
MAVMSTRGPLTRRAGRGSFAMAQLATLVALAALIVALLIGAAILLYVYAPHTTGSAVTWLKHAASWLTAPFHHMVRSSGDRRIWLNWGIAAAIYLVGGTVIARLLRASSRL